MKIQICVYLCKHNAKFKKMKGKIIALLVGACCSFSALAQTNTNDDWKLVWNDEFDGNGPLVIERWKAEHGFVRNEEYQWYQQQNAYRQEGVLVLEGSAANSPSALDGWR